MVTFVFRERVVEALKEGIYRSMEMYGKETGSNTAVDFLQSKVGCCGVTEHSDWRHTQWGRGHRDRLPHSCCEVTRIIVKSQMKNCDQVTTSGVCRPEARDAELHRLGCHTLITGTLERHSLMIVTMLLVTTLVHGAAVITSFCLAR